MKEFMLIFVGKDYGDIGLSPEQMQERMGKWFAWNTKMQEAGVVKDGHALRADDIRRVSGPDRVVTDRTSIDTKELVGGYYIVTAEDYDGAMKIAEDYPDYDLGGTVEIREVMIFNR